MRSRISEVREHNLLPCQGKQNPKAMLIDRSADIYHELLLPVAERKVGIRIQALQ